ncbi:hypothetical protein NIES3787_26490 [Microcystis aeruginosa NIES-3787]|uniref:Uncharacterized protein n=1 Tax=Microcystis aeruginosa NIES-3787 TaxID=2517782 RepID=A0A6H9GAC3_MICAE|nr:hypothetical protein NIES3787_26490 [Microcystis aeruginosa NIES-3787]
MTGSEPPCSSNSISAAASGSDSLSTDVSPESATTATQHHFLPLHPPPFQNGAMEPGVIVSPLSNGRSNLSDPDTSASPAPTISSPSAEQATKPSIFSTSYVRLPAKPTMRNGLLSIQDILAPPSLGENFCLWSSPEVLSTGNPSRPGQSKLETQLKKEGVIKEDERLNPRFLESISSIPTDWTNPLDNRTAIQFLATDESLSLMPSTLKWPPSPSPASSTLILSKIPLLGDTDVSLTSTKVFPSKEQESLLGNTDVSLTSTKVSLSKEQESLLGNTDVSLTSTKVSLSKEETENKRPRRRRGEGSGYFITTYSQQAKYGRKYLQTFYQVEFGKRKRSIYLASEKVDRIRELDRMGKPIGEILKAIDSPKAREVLAEYRDFLKNK